MALVFRFTGSRRHFIVMCGKEVVQIPLSIDIADNFPQAHRFWPAGIPSLERADTQTVAEQQFLVERSCVSSQSSAQKPVQKLDLLTKLLHLQQQPGVAFSNNVL